MTTFFQLNNSLRQLLRRFEVDRAVFFAILTRVWQAAVAPVTILLIARYFTPEVQGFYYTFASLLALQSFVELGLYIVIINVASHEWSRLRINPDGHIEGDQDALSRLVSLGRLIFKWYAAASVIFFVGVSIIGYIFFSRSNYPGIQWQEPWLAVVLLTSLLLWMLPFNSLLEGCNQVLTINLFRFIQAVISSLMLWLAFILNWGLWVAVAIAAVRLMCDMYLLLVHYRRFFRPFFNYPVGARISWKTEIWPMQWRLGLSGVVNYFAFSLFTPVMFYYHGAVVAGRMGMTLQIVGALVAVGMAWVTTKVPRFGILIAQKDYKTLDRFWLRTSLISLSVVSAGAFAVWIIVYGLNMFHLAVAQRLLSLLPFGLFLLAGVLMQVSQCLTAYLRAHRQEPIVVMSVTCSLIIGLLVWLLGSRFGPVGTAWGYFAVIGISVIWETKIWVRCRSKWHED